MSVKLPAVLSFERKLEASDALMYAGNWGDDLILSDDWKDIPLTLRKNRGTKSSFEHRNKPEELSEANLAEGEDANLPHDRDTLKVSFSLRIIGNVGKPFACNIPEFEAAVSRQIGAYKESSNGLKTLALRYAYNIVNGRFLWRNRVCAEKILIHVKTEAAPKGLSFDAYEFSLNDFNKNVDNADLQRLAEAIHTGLKGDDNSFTLVEVDAYVKLGNGQHVFPSQEMNMGEKKKVLFQLNNCAAMHNVKIGNAIRTIDNWYENAEFPIAVEPYGSVTQMGQAYRRSRTDLYTLMLDWLNEKDNVSDDDKNFVVANFIRGGVFGGKGE